MKIAQLVILAGGKGTRLQSVLAGLPKPLAPIAGRPVLEHQIDVARRYGITRVLFLTSYGASAIRDHFGDGEHMGVSIEYVQDPAALGTAGATVAARAALDEEFFLLYGDALFDVDLERMARWHQAKKADLTIMVHPNDHPHDSDLLELTPHCRVTAIHGYPHPEKPPLRNLVNAGLYVIRRDALPVIPENALPCDFAKNLFPKLIQSGLRVFGYHSREYIKDMGTPDRLQKVSEDFTSGRVAARNAQVKMPAIFLDRDGTLIRHVDQLNAPSQVELLPGAGEAAAILNRSGYLCVVLTNQPVIARGECTEADLEHIHAVLETQLGRHKAFLDAIYHCPHHPDKGFPGERTELKIACDCRKPRTAMVDSAARDLNIDIERSWVIGDTTADIQLAANAGMRSILVRTGSGGLDGKWVVNPTYVCDDILDAVKFVLSLEGHS